MLAPWDMRSQHPSFSKNGCAGSLGHALRTRSFEKRETKEKRGVYVKWKRAYFLGKNAVVQWASAPGLVCEVLEMEPAWEQALSRLLTHAARSQLCEGWRPVCPQISPYQLYYLFHAI